MCHRAATADLALSSHRLLVPERAAGQALDDWGCVTCHGPWEEHVERAKGSGPVPPGTYAPPSGLCLDCHPGPADLHRGVPEFRPDRRCDGCHRIHAPSPARAAPRASRDDRARRLGPFEISGFVEGGWQAVSVSGDGGTFAQDWTLSPGPRLRALRIEGRAEEEAPFDAFLVEAGGVGDPHTFANVEARREGLWRARAGYRRDESVFNAGALDPTESQRLHASDATRRSGWVDLHASPWGPQGPLLSVDASRGEKDGTFYATVPLDSPAFAATLGPAPNDTDETLRTVGGSARFEVADFSVFVREEVRWLDAAYDRNADGPSPGDPASTHTNRASFDSEVTQFPTTIVRVSRAFLDGDVRFDAGVRREEADGTGDFEETIQGFFAPGVPFTSTRDGRARFERERFGADAGIAVAITPEVEVAVRVEREEDDHDASDRIDAVLTVPPGPGIPTQLGDDTKTEAIRTRAQGEVRWRVSPALDLRAGWEATQQRIHLEGGTFAAPPVGPGTLSEKLEGSGPTAGITVRPARRLVVDVDARAFDGEAFTGKESEERYELRAKARWRPSRPLHLFAHGRVRRGEVDGFEEIVPTLPPPPQTTQRFDASSKVDDAGAGFVWVPAAPLSAGLSYLWRRTDLESDTVFPLGIDPLSPAVVEFEDTSHSVASSIGVGWSERLRTSGLFTFTRASGDASFRAQEIGGRLEWDVRRNLTAGLEARWFEFEPHDPNPQDGYDAWVALVFARLSL